jgi:hypothetical protein
LANCLSEQAFKCGSEALRLQIVEVFRQAVDNAGEELQF